MSMRCITTFISMFHLAASLAIADYRLTITNGSKAVEYTPVTAVLPEGFSGKDVALVETGTGKEIVAQADQVDGRAALTWISEPLKENERRELQLVQRSPKASPANVSVSESNGELTVNINGQLFTRYLTRGTSRPFLWPIMGPGGKEMTRNYPMKQDVPGETKDHIHHRSLWFAHGHVNGHDFWSELDRAGKTVHTKYGSIISGPVFGEFVSHVDWIAKDGRRVCTDDRRIRFYALPNGRMFDFDLTMKAPAEGLEFGDDKEGTFALRVASSLDVDAAKRTKGKGGTLVSSEGLKNDQVWGKRAAWCDYMGPIGEQTAGIAIFDHPTNLRHPTYWHARTYGLFAANPFGIRAFTNDKSADGSHRVPPNGSIRFQYRLYLHDGTTTEASVPDYYQGYASPPTISIQK